MLRTYLRKFAYLLLLLLPLQSVAAANMLVCNSLMQASAAAASNQPDDLAEHVMPCHNMAIDQAEDQAPHTDHATKTNCSTLCSSFCAAAALVHSINIPLHFSAASRIAPVEHSYVSITLPAVQRPPIFLS